MKWIVMVSYFRIGDDDENKDFLNKKNVSFSSVFGIKKLSE